MVPTAIDHHALLRLVLHLLKRKRIADHIAGQLAAALRIVRTNNEDLQEQVISIVNTATANGAGLEENIVTLAKNHGFTVTEDDVTQHADFLGQDGDLTDFELEMISGGVRSAGKS